MYSQVQSRSELKIKDRIFDSVLVVAFSVVSVLSVFALPSLADDPGSTAIDTINTDFAKISTLVDTAAPMAEGAVVFGAGMQTLKRFVYA